MYITVQFTIYELFDIGVHTTIVPIGRLTAIYIYTNYFNALQ